MTKNKATVPDEEQNPTVQAPPETANGHPPQPVDSALALAAAPLDPFDPASYSRPEDDRLKPTGESLPAAIHCGRPLAAWFFRIHPDPAYRCMVRVFCDRTKSRNGANYLWSPNLPIPDDIDALIRPTLVAAAVTDQQISFLYMVAETSSWYESACTIMKEAMLEWRKQAADKEAGEYVGSPAISDLGEPKFPDVPFRVYLERAFRRHLITTLEDPVVRRIRGVR